MSIPELEALDEEFAGLEQLLGEDVTGDEPQRAVLELIQLLQQAVQIVGQLRPNSQSSGGQTIIASRLATLEKLVTVLNDQLSGIQTELVTLRKKLAG